jgi:hypothetical protein
MPCFSTMRRTEAEPMAEQRSRLRSALIGLALALCDRPAARGARPHGLLQGVRTLRHRHRLRAFATAIVFGLGMASLLTLFVVPALYLGLEDLKAALRRRRGDLGTAQEVPLRAAK